VSRIQFGVQDPVDVFAPGMPDESTHAIGALDGARKADDEDEGCR